MKLLWGRITRIYQYRLVVRDMVLQKVKNKYAGARLGIWWSIISPLLLTVSIQFIFTNVFSVPMAQYHYFILAGIIPWLYFSTTISESTQAFLAGSSVFKQALFPRECVVLATVIANLFSFSLGFCFLFPLFIVFHWNVVLLIPVLVVLVVAFTAFILGLSLIFSVLNIFVRDFFHLLNIIMMIWFWATPVFYEPSMLSASNRWLTFINPMTYFILAFQSVLFKNQLPSFFTLGCILMLSCGVCLCGYLFYLRSEAKLLKVL